MEKTMSNEWDKIKKIRKKNTSNPNINIKPELHYSLVKETTKKKTPKPKEIDRHAVISFGRMNPISKGHEAHVNFVRNLSIEHEADPMVFLSKSEGDHRNPIPYKEKLKYARKAFGSIIKHTPHKNIIEILKHLNKSYNHMHVVVGNDRHDEFGTLLQKYNGKEYNYKKLKVHSSGARDPAVSGTHMRRSVATNDMETFSSSLPDKLKPHAQEIFNHIKGSQNK